VSESALCLSKGRQGWSTEWERHMYPSPHHMGGNDRARDKAREKCRRFFFSLVLVIPAGCTECIENPLLFLFKFLFWPLYQENLRGLPHGKRGLPRNFYFLL
jgi:hypothetical protein